MSTAKTRAAESTSSHSVRTPNDTWARANARAKRDGVKMNRVIIELLEGYARGIYRLPKKRVKVERDYGHRPAVTKEPEAVAS
jgi:hypothetical protein